VNAAGEGSGLSIAPFALLAPALLHAKTAKRVAAGEQHLGPVRGRHEIVAHSTRVCFELLGKARFQHSARLQLVA
jgi:hypothetical protein